MGQYDFVGAVHAQSAFAVSAGSGFVRLEKEPVETSRHWFRPVRLVGSPIGMRLLSLEY